MASKTTATVHTFGILLSWWLRLDRGYSIHPGSKSFRFPHCLSEFHCAEHDFHRLSDRALEFSAKPLHFPFLSEHRLCYSWTDFERCLRAQYRFDVIGGWRLISNAAGPEANRPNGDALCGSRRRSDQTFPLIKRAVYADGNHLQFVHLSCEIGLIYERAEESLRSRG